MAVVHFRQPSYVSVFFNRIPNLIKTQSQKSEQFAKRAHQLKTEMEQN